MPIDPVVLVIGDTNPDLVLRGDSGPTFGQAERLLDAADLVLGGSAAIMACGLARLGVPTAIAGLVGDDLMGGFVRTALEERGVDTRWLGTDPVRPTALTVVISAGDRAILTHPGALSTTTAAAVPDLDLLPSLRHVHAASYFLLPMLAPALEGIFRHARELGLTTSLDTNWDPAERWSGVEHLLPSCGHAAAERRRARGADRRVGRGRGCGAGHGPGVRGGAQGRCRGRRALDRRRVAADRARDRG